MQRLLLLAGFWACTLGGTAQAAWPPIISELKVTGAERIRLAGELDQILTFGAGDPLHLERLDYLVKLMTLRQDVESASIIVHRQGDDKVVVEILIRPERVIRDAKIVFDRKLRHGRDRISRSGQLLQVPVVYSQSAVATAARRLQDELIELGYRDATVEPIVQWPSSHNGVLLLKVERGDLYRIDSFTWEGLTGGAAEVDQPAFEGKPWDRQETRDRLQDYVGELREAGYYEADFELSCLPRVDTPRAECVVVIDQGPATNLSFTGNQTFFEPDLIEVLDVDTEIRNTSEDLRRRADRLTDFYSSRRFFFASITAAAELDHGEQTITYYIDEGPRTFFRDIHFVGPGDPIVDVISELTNVNGRVPGKKELIELVEGDRFTPLPEDVRLKLRKSMNTGTAALEKAFLGKTGNISRQNREDDIERLDVALRRMGYLNGRVVGEFVQQTADDVAWIIQIDPGPHFQWGDLRFPDSVTLDSELDIPDNLVAGRSADTVAMQEYAQNWIQVMRRLGYLDAYAQANISARKDERVIDATLETFQGPRYKVAGVIVRGIERTRRSAVVNLLPLRVGEVASQDELLRGRRLLLERRVFDLVNASWELKDPSTGQVVAVYELEERNGGEIETGLLLTTNEGVGVDFSVSHNRLFGSFRSVQLAGSVLYEPEDIISGKFYRRRPFRMRFGFLYREPLPNGIPVFGDVQGTIELNRNDDDIDWLAQSIFSGPTWDIDENASLSFGYQYEWFKPIRVKNDAFALAGLAVLDQVTHIGSFRTSGVYQEFDNRFDPKVGWGTYHELQVANQALAGDVRFARYEGSLTFIQPLFGTVTFWSSVRGGLIELHSERFERVRSKVFRLGGNGSVRGYQRDSVSPYALIPLDTTGDGVVDGSCDSGADGLACAAIAVGGDGFASLQSEIRLGITESLEIAIFEDNAIVSGFDLSNVFAAGYGAGILFHTPAGPLRLDLGRKIRKIPTDRDKFTVHFYVATGF